MRPVLARKLRIGGHFSLSMCVLVAGCALSGGSMALPTMTHAEQQAAILKVVPEGTPRDQAVKKLQQAGIEGGFGISDSIYYCDAWRRGGDVSHLDVALLFDEQGKLYSTRPANSPIQSERAPTTLSEVTASANEPTRSDAASNAPVRSSAASTTRIDRQNSTNPFATEEF